MAARPRRPSPLPSAALRLPWSRDVHGILGHAARYGISGGLATLTLYAVLVLLVEVGGVDETLASAIAFACATPVNYGLQHRFVFESEIRHAESFPCYLAVTAVTLVLNTALFWLLDEPVGMPYPLAQAVTLGVITPINFVLNRTLTFAVGRQGQPKLRSSPPPAEGSPAMAAGGDRVVAALAETIVRARCPEHPVEPAALRATVDFVLAQKAGMPDYLRRPMQLATLVFDLWALPRAGRRFHRLPEARRQHQLATWSTSRFGPMRDLIKFYETLVLFGWYSERDDDHA